MITPGGVEDNIDGCVRGERSLLAAGNLPCQPVKRNFVHVEDLVSAILLALDHPQVRQQTFNSCMGEPVYYGDVGRYLIETRGLPTAEIRTPYHSTRLASGV